MEEDNCISKCFRPNISVLHPLFLKPISSKKPFCLVNNENYFEECETSLFDDENDYFVPKINMSEKLILKNIYNINSWEDVLSYQNKNKNDSITTITRILNFSWISFYKNIKNDIDIIINCYNNFFENYNLKKKNIKLSKIINNTEKNIIKYNPNKIHDTIMLSIK